MTKIMLDIPEISCDHCAKTITKALGEQPGVETVQVDVPKRQAAVVFDGSLIDRARIEHLLDDEGYPVESTTTVEG